MARRYGTGTVFCRKRDGKWLGQADAGRGPDGARLRITTAPQDTEAKAWAALAKVRSSSTRRRRGRAGESVAAFLARWLRDVVAPTKRERTYWGYRSIVEHALVPAFGERDVRELAGRDVQRWVAGLTVKPRTVHHYVTCASGAWAWGMRAGLVDANPFRGLDLPRMVRRDVAPMTPDLARRLQAAVEDEWFAPLVTVALYTGLRQGELLGLRWEDVNLGEDREVGEYPFGSGLSDVGLGRRAPGSDNLASRKRRHNLRAGASLTVTHALSRQSIPGQGVKYVLTEPKSATSRRTVPLAAPAAAFRRLAPLSRGVVGVTVRW